MLCIVGAWRRCRKKWVEQEKVPEEEIMGLELQNVIQVTREKDISNRRNPMAKRTEVRNTVCGRLHFCLLKTS